MHLSNKFTFIILLLKYADALTLHIIDIITN